MPYLVQSEEHDLTYELFQQLAAAIDESPDLTYADATNLLRHGRGVLHVESKAEADRLYQRFSALGYSCFVLDNLLEVPKAEPLSPEATVEEAPEIIAVGRVELVTEKVVHDWDALRVHFTTPGRWDAGLDDYRVEEHDLRYYLNLLTLARHWQVHPGSLVPHLRFLKQLDTRQAMLNVSVRNLLAGNHTVLRFRGEEDYLKHICWLYQVRYAAR